MGNSVSKNPEKWIRKTEEMEKIKEVVEEEINSNLIIKLVNINKSLVKNENI